MTDQERKTKLDEEAKRIDEEHKDGKPVMVQIGDKTVDFNKIRRPHTVVHPRANRTRPSTESEEAQ